MAEALHEAVGGEIVYDPDPHSIRSAWRTYRHALETTPAGVSHRLVVQEDATVCPGFLRVVTAAINARPDSMVCLCVCGDPWTSAQAVIDAGWKGLCWAKIDPTLWVPAIALSWPVRLIQPALEWVDEQGWPSQFSADDEIIGRVMRQLSEPVWATVPSLVNHLDLVNSVGARHTRRGQDPGRVAACPWPDGCDLTQIDWTV